MSEYTPIRVKELKMTDEIARFSDLTAVIEKCEKPFTGAELDLRGIEDQDLVRGLSGLVATLGGKVVVEEKANYKFTVLADIHLYDKNEPEDAGEGRGFIDFKTALSASNLHGVEFMSVCGDVGYGRPTFDTTKKFFEDAVADAAPEFPIRCCTGNHDQYLSEEEWTGMTGCPLSSFYVKRGKDIFFYLSLSNLYAGAGENGNHGDANQPIPYPRADVQLFKQVLAENPGSRVFLFMHFPLNAERTVDQYPGIGQQYYGMGSYRNTGTDNNGCRIYYYGFKLASDTLRNEQNEELVEAIKAFDGQIFVFSGHTHFRFEVDKWIDNVNYMEIAPGKHLFHVPSLNFPRNRAAQTIAAGDEENQPSQGYIVEVCDTEVRVNGYEFNQNFAGDPKGKLVRRYVVR